MLNFVCRFLLVTFVSLPFYCLAVPADKSSLSIVFAANMPEITNPDFGSYSQLATLLEKVRRENDNSLFIFGGGSLGPSVLSSLDRGSHIIDILNTLEPDLMALEKRELSYSADQLTLRSFEAAFPLISSNVYDPLTKANLEGIATNLVFEKAGRRIGVISMLDDDTASEYPLGRVQVQQPEKIIEEQLTVLKQQDVNMIILVFSKEQPIYTELLASKKIDIALSTSRKSQQQFSPGLLNMPGFYVLEENQPCLLLNISWGVNFPQDIKFEKINVNLTHLSKNVSTELLLNEYTNRLNRLLNQAIGQLASNMDTRKQLIRTEESAFGNFVADALRASTHADIALVNAGGIRGNQQYAANTVLTRADIIRELPFRHLSTVIKVTGKQLLEALENSVSKVESVEGRFAQISGMQFSYWPHKPVGQRIKSVLVQGASLDLTQNYNLAVSAYIAKGNDGYASLAEAYNQQAPSENPSLLADIVTTAIIKQRVIDLKTSGRITRLVE